MEQILRMFGVKRYNNLGFTLVELLVTVVIIGILMGIAVPMFIGQRTKAMLSECHTNLQVLFTLEEQFYAEYGRYAPWPDKSIPTSVTYSKYGAGFGYQFDEDFPQFRPGPVSDLKFDYWIDTRGTGGDGFDLSCGGKAGTPVDGIKFKLDENNEMVSL